MSAYYIRQSFPELYYQVVPLGRDQAERLAERGEKVYDNPRQAHTVADAMNSKARGSQEGSSRSRP